MATSATAPIGSALWTFASTASLALPEPFGAIASGAFAVVNLFFGETGDPNQGIRDALTAAVIQFQSQTLAGVIQAKSVDIKTAAHWLETQIQTVQDIRDMQTASPFVKELVGKLSDVDAPNAPLPTALMTLNDPTYLNDPALGPSAYRALTFGVGLYLTFLRLRVQMQSWQASQSDSDLNYAWFDIFRQETELWCGVVDNQIDEYESARLSQLSPVERNGPFYNFKDAGTRPAAAGPPPVAGWAGTNYGPVTNDNNGQMLKQSQDDWTTYTGYVGADLDTLYGSDTKAIETWMDNMETWENSIVPLVPTDAPALIEPEVWEASTPQGSNWVSGAAVQYAVVFANEKGQSKMGPWSSWIPITTRAFPTLSLPTDPMELASTRHIHRQFRNGPANVFIVADNTTVAWQDNNL